MYSGQRLDALDTRTIFKAYAALAGLFGLGLFLWGPMWLGVHLAEQPWGRAALVRSFGSILMAAACCAVGFAGVPDSSSRRRALFWFALGHNVIWLVVVVQQAAIWGHGLADTVSRSLMIVVLILFYLWATAEGESRGAGSLLGLFATPSPDAGDKLRSQFEQQIRQGVRLEERNRLARDLHDSIK